MWREVGGKCQVSVGGCEEVLREVWGSVGRGLEKCGGKVCGSVFGCREVWGLWISISG